MREVKKRSGPRQAKPISPNPDLPLLSVDACGKPHANLDNAVRLLEDSDIRLDVFANRIYVGGQPLTDEILLKLQRWLQQAALPRIGKDTVCDAVRLCASGRPYDPPREYLESLAWDRTPRLKTFWQTYCGAEMDSGYLGAVGPNWWISMVARIFKPGCKVDTMPVLEGKQGKRKSAFLKIVGGAWFAENTQTIGTKDFYLSLAGRVLIEFAELDAFAKADVTLVKQMLTCECDNYRPPFARGHEDFPRRATFAGTTNKSDWARDDTGERRFWPIACGEINLELLSRDRDQLFAEAAAAYREGQSWWMVPEIAAEIQGARHEEDVWEPAIADWDRQHPYFAEVTSAYVLSEVVGKPLKDQGKPDQMRVSKILGKLGWEKSRSSATGVRERCWRRILKPDPPILADLTDLPVF